MKKQYPITNIFYRVRRIHRLLPEGWKLSVNRKWAGGPSFDLIRNHNSVVFNKVKDAETFALGLSYGSI